MSSSQEAAEPVGVLLAGGRSRRMGRDKAALRIPGDGRTLAELALERLTEVCRQVVVAGPAEREWGQGLPSIPDGPGAGPIAGLLGAALAHPGQRLLALGCDLPEVTTELLSVLAASPAELAIPVGARGPEPLCALYGPSALRALEERAEAGSFALRGLLDGKPSFEIDRLEGERLARYGNPEKLFFNLNRPDQLDAWLAERRNR